MEFELLKYNKRGSETIPLKFLLPFWSDHVKNSLLCRANLWNKLVRQKYPLHKNSKSNSQIFQESFNKTIMTQSSLAQPI